MKRPTILVTGGAGYIGSHTVVALQQAGYGVVVVDNFSNAHRRVIDDIGSITGTVPALHAFDLCDERATEAFFRDNAVDAVVHFAALKAVGDSVTDPLGYYRNNLVSLINVAAQCIRYGVHHMVFSSSCTVYGQPDKLPVDETAPIGKAESPYGRTKQIAEDILLDATGASPLRVISLRYFNPVGAHASALIGEYPIGKPTNLMPVMAQVAAGKLPRLEVFGDDYQTPDGSCIRDYIHVVDVAEAHVKAVQRLLDGAGDAPFEVFNLGTGAGYSVLEMVNEFIRRTGIRIDYRIGPRRPGDIEKVYADVQKISREMKWEARYGLADMIDSAWQWEQALGRMERIDNP